MWHVGEYLGDDDGTCLCWNEIQVFGPDMFTKISTNPKLSPYLKDKDYVDTMNKLQKNPQLIETMMNDKRVMNTLIELMGLSGMMKEQPAGDKVCL